VQSGSAFFPLSIFPPTRHERKRQDRRTNLPVPVPHVARCRCVSGAVQMPAAWSKQGAPVGLAAVAALALPWSCPERYPRGRVALFARTQYGAESRTARAVARRNGVATCRQRPHPTLRSITVARRGASRRHHLLSQNDAFELPCDGEELLGWDSAAALALMTGSSEASFEPGRALNGGTTAKVAPLDRSQPSAPGYQDAAPRRSARRRCIPAP
jgi:hypothetical protein